MGIPFSSSCHNIPSISFTVGLFVVLLDDADLDCLGVLATGDPIGGDGNVLLSAESDLLFFFTFLTGFPFSSSCHNTPLIS